MAHYLILKLCGPLQAWGVHTYEDYRPTQSFPTRSGIIGLLCACLGIRREDKDRILALNAATEMAVRIDHRSNQEPVTIVDFHTVQEARKVNGRVNPNPVVSRREYLCDVEFSVAIRLLNEDHFNIDQITQALQKPVFTPYLGRRSCPLSRPPYETSIEAESLIEALSKVEPYSGLIYSDKADNPHSRMILRDVPMPGRSRQFATRSVHIENQAKGKDHVS